MKRLYLLFSFFTYSYIGWRFVVGVGEVGAECSKGEKTTLLRSPLRTYSLAIIASPVSLTILALCLLTVSVSEKIKVSVCKGMAKTQMKRMCMSITKAFSWS